MITDPISDLFTRIRNIVMAHKTEVSVPYSKMKESIAEVLKREGYLSDVKRVKNELVLTIAVKRRQAQITGIKNVSRPGLRIYREAKRLPRPLGGAGISIISTSHGIMSNKEAFKQGLGGEVLGEVW
jgi:small subunit ribosomal protein S8